MYKAISEGICFLFYIDEIKISLMLLKMNIYNDSIMCKIMYNRRREINKGGVGVRRKLFLKICVLLLILVLPIQIAGAQSEKNVYVIPIKGEIGPAVYEYVKERLNTIEQDPNVAAVIFEIDTYGGRIDSADNISQLILDTAVPTISFVKTKAISAGVLLTISSDKIVMAPRSTIGAAETIPNTEKALSAWTSMLRTVAQEKGRDPELIAAMADKSISIPGVIEEGKLLSLTTKEAEKLGLIDLVESNYEGILKSLDIDYTDIIKEEISSSVRWAQILSSSYVVPILLTIGFVGLVIEVLTAGFGIAGTVSLISFALYFGGSFLAGNAGITVIILFIAGVILLAIEAFIPGFGVPGIGGIVCIIISIVLAANSIATAVVSLLIAFVLTVIAVVLILKYAPRNKFFDRIILSTVIEGSKGHESPGKYEQYVGQVGTVVTFLRPAGTIDIDGNLLDVVSEGTFIEVGSKVKVMKVEGKKIIVRKID